MGACGSSMTEEEMQSKKVEAAERRRQQAESEKIKLLLLGAGESGKSTLFKQMKILFSEQHGFSQQEISTAIKTVYNNTLTNMKTLLANCESHTPAEDSGLADEIMGLEDGAVVDAVLADKLRSIWADAGVQATWALRSDFQVQDALAYFIANLDRIESDEYVPTNQDILRTRVRTSGIVEAEYNIEGVKISMYDVGGQRNERKKWIHAFDNVTAVIFVAAISEYDQVLYEDASTGRQDEAVSLFQEMRGSEWFRNKSMILFLNKRDLFREKLQAIPFKVESGPHARNIDYNGPAVVPGTASAEDGTPEFEVVYKATTNYLIDLYKRAGKQAGSMGEVYIKVTCATDSDQVATIMQSTKDIVLRSNLSESGFI